METISQRELRNDNATIVARVAAGESFVVTRRGVPIADLLPHRPGPRIDLTFTPATDLVTAFADEDGPDTGAWLDDIRAAERFIDDAPRDPWDDRG